MSPTGEIFSSFTVQPETGLTERGNGSPAEDLPDSSPDVGKIRLIFECRHARSTDDTFKLLLALPLLLRIGNHSEQEPVHCCGGLRMGLSSVSHACEDITYRVGTSRTGRCLYSCNMGKQWGLTTSLKIAKLFPSHSGGYDRVVEVSFQRNSCVRPLGPARCLNQ